MSKANIRIQEAASYRIDEIYRYTRDRWDTQQADRYITGLFNATALRIIEHHHALCRPTSVSKATFSALNDISSIGAGSRAVISGL
jgi:plasmid stabilization system protein ParE